MAKYNVDVYLDEQWVKTVYGVPADSPADAVEHVSENLALDFSVEDDE